MRNTPPTPIRNHLVMYSPPRLGYHSRLDHVLTHIPKYSFDTYRNLARDARISRASAWAIVTGKQSPSLPIAAAIAGAVGNALGKRIDVLELFTFNGTFPTASVCDLVGCAGCLPDVAYEPDGARKPQFKDLTAGEWRTYVHGPVMLSK